MPLAYATLARMGDVRERIANHDPKDCDACWEFRDRRWRNTWTKKAGEAHYRDGLVRHVRVFAGRAVGRHLSYPEDVAAMDEFVGRGEKRAAAIASRPTEAPAWVPDDMKPLWRWLDYDEEIIPTHVLLEDGRSSLAVPELEIPEDLEVRPGHDATTCPVCVYWARACVCVLPNIEDLERQWVKRRPDDHIWSGIDDADPTPAATEEQRAFWRESFEHTSRVIEHVFAVRPKGEDALTWHGRVLRAAAPDDETAMDNLRWSEWNKGRRERGGSYKKARKDEPPPAHLYRDGVPPIGGGYSSGGNRLLVKYLRTQGLDWAEGTRYAENLPVELIRHAPAFLRKPARH
ncbi:MAG: hypothetical protein C0498_01710 [Anaerolinea sp.]|nr:hypothetical protein [Anaerolinea sp.]